MIKTNSKIDNYLKQKISQDDLEITFKEVDKLGIKHDEDDIDINENTFLKRVYLFKSFKITLKDIKKDYYNKILDKYIDKGEIIRRVSEYSLTKDKYKQFKKQRQAEVEWNKDLEVFLKKYFQNVKRGNPNKSIEIDIDLGNGMAGLELKWADKINKNNPMNAVVGQIDGYYRNGNYENLFLIVAGFNELLQDPLLMQLEKRIMNTHQCNYIFIEIK